MIHLGNVAQDLVIPTTKGLYVPLADVYIDPWRRVPKALITHAHSDHARSGMRQYISCHDSIPILKHRLGSFINIYGYPYGEEFTINGVQFSFHPAGHVIGSAQIRIEYKGEVWVVSGDYKLENDGISTAFQPIPCHTFITESTFGLPIFHWLPQSEIFQEINKWWQQNTETNTISVVSAYSLGKAQRLLSNIDTSIGPIYAHGAIENVNEIFRNQNINLPKVIKFPNQKHKSDLSKALVIAPPNSISTTWGDTLGDVAQADLSGWMALKSTAKKRKNTFGFILSDHADWNGLNKAIKATGATRILVTHGYTTIFAKWLSDQGYDASTINTHFEGETNNDGL